MKVAVIAFVILLSGCATSCDLAEGISISKPDTQNKNMKNIPKYWDI